MAKKSTKKPAKKAATKKAEKPKAKLKIVKPGSKKIARPKVGDTGKAKPVARTPKSQALPGLEQVRNATLDRASESIADCRATINGAKADEAGYVQVALREMMKVASSLGQSTYSYKHAGVELLLVPGDAKLRVRALRDGGEGDEGGRDVDEPIVMARPELEDVAGLDAQNGVNLADTGDDDDAGDDFDADRDDEE
jgi:hypothetical protein